MRDSPPPPPVPSELREADALLARVADTTRMLPALTADGAHEERARLVDILSRGEIPVPAFDAPRPRVAPLAFRCLEAARLVTRGLPVEDLYHARIEELELELAMMAALGDPRRVRPLAARRYGTGRTEVSLPEGSVPLARVASAILDTAPREEEARIVPAHDPSGAPSLARLVLHLAERAGLTLEVKIEPRLAAGAATGDRTVFLSDRRFGAREALRFAVHEVLGHAVAAANARDQPLRLLELGTADSFGTQEGLAVLLEEEAGLLDGYRLRILAARVLVADRMHQGAPFGDTARWLLREHGFSPADAIGLAERAYRGGGVARDAGYLQGWLRVRAAVRAEETSLDALRAGRLGLEAARRLPALVRAGLARLPRYRPSLARSLGATEDGTSWLTSPPSRAASFTMFDET